MNVVQIVARRPHIILQTDEATSFHYRRDEGGAWQWLGVSGTGEWQAAPAGKVATMEGLYAAFVADIAPIAPLDWLGVWRP